MEIKKDGVFIVLVIIIWGTNISASSGQALSKNSDQVIIGPVEQEKIITYSADSTHLPETRSKSPEEIDRENELFFELIENDSLQVGLVENVLNLQPDELIDLARQVRVAGINALIEHEIFSQFFQGEIKIAEHKESKNNDYFCNTIALPLLTGAAKLIDAEDADQLIEQIQNILISNNFELPSILDTQGEEWFVPIEDGEGNNESKDDNNETQPEINLNLDGEDSELGIHRAALFGDLSGNRSYFQPRCDADPHLHHRFVYRIPNKFDIDYTVCGNRAVLQHKKENADFGYYLPNGALVKIRKCTSYTSSCAPSIVQIIGAELVYAMEQFDKEGFRRPKGGLGLSKEIPVELFSGSGGVSSGFLGALSLDLNQPISSKNLTFKHLVHHEYFHLIQEQYGVNLSWFTNPSVWAGPTRSRFPDHIFWATLESTADFAADVIGDTHAFYKGRFYDTNSTPFRSSYYSLPYGHLAEKFTRQQPSKMCFGCDTLLFFMRDYAEKFGWDARAITQFIKERGFSYPDYLDIYYFEMLASLYKNMPAPARMRFNNRHLDNKASISLLDWPPGLKIPVTDKSCQPLGIPIRNKNATEILSEKRTKLTITCNYAMVPGGAVYYHIGLDSKDLPTELKITASATPLASGAGPSVSTIFRPQINAVLSSRKTPKAKTFPFLEVISAHQSRGPLEITGIDHKKNPDNINELQFFVRHPDFLWAYGISRLLRHVVKIEATWDDNDHDGILNNVDNCPNAYNPLQIDSNPGVNKKGDECEDRDFDNLVDAKDNCKGVSNPGQFDADRDGAGDACDNCKFVSNWRQTDKNQNNTGDVCEIDIEIESVNVYLGQFIVNLRNNGFIPIDKWWKYNLGVSGTITTTLGNQINKASISKNAPMYQIVPSSDWGKLVLNPGASMGFRISKSYAEPGDSNALTFVVDAPSNIDEADENNNFYLMSR